uniref:Phage tail collar domain-containing protein n=1 Tax=viral metagenome TaxID=1070528 RepID=A0A6C0JIE1_9ZZZZ
MSGFTFKGKEVAYPVGTIIQFCGNGTSDPDGWIICDGQPRTAPNNDGRYFYLADIFNTIQGVLTNNSNSVTPPDLRSRFLYGSNTTSSNIGTVNGSSTIKLTSSTIPSHTHSGTTGVQSANHAHGITRFAESSYVNVNLRDGGTAIRVAASAVVLTTSGQSANHKHDFTSAATGYDAASITPLSILPPCFTINHIIKY